MTEIFETRDKIVSWVIEEGWNIEVAVDANAFFNLVVHPNDTQTVNVFMARSQPYKIYLKVRIMFKEEDKRGFLLVPEIEKREFMTDMEIMFIQINLIYSILPQPPNKIESVELTKQIYLDGLTRDKFFDSIIAILRGLQVAQLSYTSLIARSS